MIAADAWFFGAASSIAACAVFAMRRASLFFPFNSRWVLALALVCIAKLLVAPHEIPPDAQFIRSEFAHEIARFVVMTQLLMLSSRDFLPSRSSVFSQLCWAVLILGCDIRVTDGRLVLLQACLALAIGLNGQFGILLRRAVASSRTISWLRTGIVVTTVVLSLAFGTAMANAVRRYERQLEWLVSNYLFPADEQFASTGFSGRGGLDSITTWQKFESEAIVLQAVSAESPGYVTGRVFDTFEYHPRRSEWMTSEPSREISECLNSPIMVKQQNFTAPVFGRPSETIAQWTSHEFWSQSRSRLFLPSDTELIAVHADRLVYSEGSYSAVERSESGELHYLAHAPSPAARVHLTDEERTTYLQPYENLDPDAARLAERLFVGCTTADERCRAVVEFLQSDFDYARQVSRPQGADQISDFLLNNRRGHCEYFASAATILLRLGGVPARYVTGYVMDEVNSVDGSWVARNKHAHAWAIAYDDQLEQWRIVEATPGDGIPESSAPSWWEERWQAMNLGWRRWLAQVREVGLFPSIGFYLSEHWMIPMISVLSAIGFTVMIRRWSGSRSDDLAAGSVIPSPWIKTLRRIDRTARRRGFVREEAETLQAFAGRIQRAGLDAVADAYREYARMRYCLDATEQQFAHLSLRVQQLKQD